MYKLITSGKKNLFYIPIDAKIGADGKILKVLKGYGLKKQYDYIWPNKDRSYVTMETAHKIQEESINGYDCIFLGCWFPMSSEMRENKPVCTNIEFFREFGWLTTSWDTSIISTKLLQNDIDWLDFEKKYNLGIHNPFNQVMVVFGGLALKNDASIRVLNHKEAQIRNNPSAESSWRRLTFELWGKKWPKAINMLPECYNLYKQKEIKEQGMLPHIFGSVDNLIGLERENILTYDVWHEFNEKWHELSDIPPKYIEKILEHDYDSIAQMSFNDFNVALFNGLYDKAYHIFTSTHCISLILGNTYYWMIKTCFDVYLVELENHINNGIVSKVKDYQDLLYKYQKLKFFVRRIEYDVDLQEHEFKAFIKNNGITLEFMSIVTGKECNNLEKVINKLEKLVYEK